MGDSIRYQTYLTFPGDLFHNLRLSNTCAPIRRIGLSGVWPGSDILQIHPSQGICFYWVLYLLFCSLYIHNINPFLLNTSYFYSVFISLISTNCSAIAALAIIIFSSLPVWLLKIILIQNQFHGSYRHIHISVIILHKHKRSLIWRHFLQLSTRTVCKIDHPFRLWIHAVPTVYPPIQMQAWNLFRHLHTVPDVPYVFSFFWEVIFYRGLSSHWMMYIYFCKKLLTLTKYTVGFLQKLPPVLLNRTWRYRWRLKFSIFLTSLDSSGSISTRLFHRTGRP